MTGEFARPVGPDVGAAGHVPNGRGVELGQRAPFGRLDQERDLLGSPHEHVLDGATAVVLQVRGRVAGMGGHRLQV